MAYIFFLLTKKIRNPCDDNRPRAHVYRDLTQVYVETRINDNNNNNDNGIGKLPTCSSQRYYTPRYIIIYYYYYAAARH